MRMRILWLANPIIWNRVRRAGTSFMQVRWRCGIVAAEPSLGLPQPCRSEIHC
jgi:hypothetical protein